MKFCYQCNRELTDYNTGDMWGNPKICWDCATKRAQGNGCRHEYMRCNCAAIPTNQDLVDTLTRLERAASMNRCWDIYDHEDFCEGFPEATDWAHGDVDEELCQALEQAENLLKEIRGE
jgi:hypothetical protein